MTIAVGMSGGLDSTIAAFLLKKKGEDVIGLTMKIWAGDSNPAAGHKTACYGPGEAADIEDARSACDLIGIRHYVVDLTHEYSATVLQDFSAEYLAGRTPNPCILCNPLIKFGTMLKKARQSGIEFSYFATGHYARISSNPEFGRYLLKRGVDPLKDQSYYLYRLNQAQLGQVIFPLGDFTKKHVREMAYGNGFAAYAKKPESQNFVDGGTYHSLFDNVETHPGKIVDRQGNVLGDHSGIQNFTIGQRKGLRIGGLEEPLYVIAKDTRTGTVTVGPRACLQFTRLDASHTNWIAIENLTQPLHATAAFRYHQPVMDCRVTPAGNDSIEVTFDRPQLAATPGQSIVFYQGDCVLGGGIIDRVQYFFKGIVVK